MIFKSSRIFYLKYGYFIKMFLTKKDYHFSLLLQNSLNFYSKVKMHLLNHTYFNKFLFYLFTLKFLNKLSSEIAYNEHEFILLILNFFNPYYYFFYYKNFFLYIFSWIVRKISRKIDFKLHTFIHTVINYLKKKKKISNKKKT